MQVTIGPFNPGSEASAWVGNPVGGAGGRDEDSRAFYEIHRAPDM